MIAGATGTWSPGGLCAESTVTQNGQEWTRCATTRTTTTTTMPLPIVLFYNGTDNGDDKEEEGKEEQEEEKKEEQEEDWPVSLLFRALGQHKKY